MRLRFHCSGSVVPLSPSLESWFMVDVVGVDSGISLPLSCIELEVLLVVLFFGIDRSWWNDSNIIGVGFSFDAMLARSPLSCNEMDVVLMVLFYWSDRSWWNGSIRIWSEFSFDDILAILTQIQTSLRLVLRLAFAVVLIDWMHWMDLKLMLYLRNLICYPGQ